MISRILSRCLNIAGLVCSLSTVFQTACLVEFPPGAPETSTDTSNRHTKTGDSISDPDTTTDTPSHSDTHTETAGDSETTDTSGETDTPSYSDNTPDGGPDGGEGDD